MRKGESRLRLRRRRSGSTSSTRTTAASTSSLGCGGSGGGCGRWARGIRRRRSSNRPSDRKGAGHERSCPKVGTCRWLLVRRGRGVRGQARVTAVNRAAGDGVTWTTRRVGGSVGARRLLIGRTGLCWSSVRAVLPATGGGGRSHRIYRLTLACQRHVCCCVVHRRLHRCVFRRRSLDFHLRPLTSALTSALAALDRLGLSVCNIVIEALARLER